MNYSPSTTKYTQEITFTKDWYDGTYLLDGVYIYDNEWNTIAFKKITGQSVTLKGATKAINDKTPVQHMVRTKTAFFIFCLLFVPLVPVVSVVPFTFHKQNVP